jgi:uncharacterized Fe-S cluster-containing radical SAM superfamily enzyme
VRVIESSKALLVVRNSTYCNLRCVYFNKKLSAPILRLERLHFIILRMYIIIRL